MSLLEIDVATSDFAEMQATLEALNPVRLDNLLRAAVNAVVIWAGGQIDKHVARAIGVPSYQLEGRMRRTLSDSRQHRYRSAWLWYGGNKLSGSHLVNKMGLEPKFTHGQVQVGKYIFRRGFIFPGKSNAALMQRETDERFDIFPIRAEIDWAVADGVAVVMPKVHAKLETALQRRIDKL